MTYPNLPSGYQLPPRQYGTPYGAYLPGILGALRVFMPGGTPTAPALFLSGQSNAGNQDNVPGTIDSRVTFTWSSAIPANGFTGPGPMVLQSGGHSFEWQCASNMAVAFNSPILVGKCWADGVVINQCLPSSVNPWTTFAAALENFAKQCVSAKISQVEFGWCQGESNTPNNVTGLLPTFQSDTSSFFDSVSALLAGFGLTTHFTIIKTNANIVTGPNPSDPSAASLATVRTDQDNLAIARTDTSTLSLDFIVPASAGNVHYTSGQTNVGGAVWASQIASRYTGKQPAFTTPPTVEAIMGASILFDYDTRAIAGLNNGDPMSLWPDLGPGAHNSVAVGAARPLYQTAALGSIPEIVFDGVDDTASVPGVAVPAPGTTPFFSMWVGRQKSWTLNKRIFGATGNFNLSLYQSDATPELTVSNASASNPTLDMVLPINTFAKVENIFSHSAGDYVQIANTRYIVGDLGNTAPGAIAMAQTAGGGFGNCGYLRWIACNAAPTKTQRDQLRGYGSKNYGLAVWGAV